MLCCQSTGRFSLCFLVNSSAFFMNFARSLLNSSARSARSGCSGSGVVTRATRLSITGGEREQKHVRLMQKNLFSHSLNIHLLYTAEQELPHHVCTPLPVCLVVSYSYINLWSGVNEQSQLREVVNVRHLVVSSGNTYSL